MKKQLFRHALKNWAFVIAIILFIILVVLWCWNPGGLLAHFFGVDIDGRLIKRPAEILTYIGVIRGSILLLGNQYAVNKRNLIMEKGQLDIRFKDAAMLLAGENTTAILSGIYALHQIAVESHKEDKQHGYVKVICEIFCSYIRENSVIERGEKREITTSEIKRAEIVFQTIMDILCREKKSHIYIDCKKDLSQSVLTGLDLSDADLSETDLSETDLSGAFLSGADLSRAFLSGAFLSDADLSRANLSDADLSDADLSGADLSGAKLSRAVIDETIINKKTNFSNTIYGGYSEEELRNKGFYYYQE